jgi:DNA cross-link repair 1B protein
MILFEGYMGTVLHTGDIRFDKEKFRDYSYLYPANQANDRFERCSKHVDVLYLDNTFCDKVFEFPTRDQAMQMLLDFVKKIGKRRFYIGLDNIGKEEMLVELAKQMETLVVVTNTRYQNILHMGFDHHIFTTDVSEGWIEVVPKKQLRALLENDKTAIGIVPTGWCNKAMYQEISRLYVSYRVNLVCAVQPAFQLPLAVVIRKEHLPKPDNPDRALPQQALAGRHRTL